MDAKKLIEEVLLDLGNNKTLTDVSSKIQIIVRLLGDNDLKNWYDSEFVKGYKDEELPVYRQSMAADIKATYFVPHGFGAMHISNQSVPVANLGMEKYKEIMTISIKDTISAIISYSNHSDDTAMSLNPYEKVLVQRVLGNAQIQTVYKVIAPATFQTIIDSVQSKIIDMFMDLVQNVFNGEIDLSSNKAQHEIKQIINNNIVAGIIHSGDGNIEANNTSIHINDSISDDVKNKLSYILDEIEKVIVKNDQEHHEIAQEIISIRSELNSINPNRKSLKNAFKALVWGTSIAAKSAIEELVKSAIESLS